MSFEYWTFYTTVHTIFVAIYSEISHFPRLSFHTFSCTLPFNREYSVSLVTTRVENIMRGHKIYVKYPRYSFDLQFFVEFY